MNTTIKKRKISRSRTLKVREIYKRMLDSEIDIDKINIKTNPIINSKMESYNSRFIELLGQLNKIMISKGEQFRARAYKKAQNTISNIKEPIYNLEMVKGKPGIGETILNKLDEYMKTGTLQILEIEKDNPVNILTNIYGIGPTKAKDLVDNHNIKTIEQLRENTHLLNDKQQIGLEYYEDILQRIPRDEIDEYKKVFEEIISDNIKSSFEIVGSYRRGASDSGDIDVILTDKEGSGEILDLFIERLVDDGIIIEILSKGKTKSMLICQLHDDSVPRRVDLMYSNSEEYPFSILYFTGSALFNTMMRQRALDKGFTMNEHGIRNKSGKVELKFANEREIFAFLELEYREPSERIDGDSIITLAKTVKVKKIKGSIKHKKLKIIDNSDIKELLNEFKKDGISILTSHSKKVLERALVYANNTYYNSQSLLSDNQYDILKEYIEQKYPNSTALTQIGAPIKFAKDKVTLPYFMGSMDKIKPDTSALEKWLSKYKGVYILSAKLDGVSALYVCKDGNENLYTRGDGKIGQDITHMIPFLNLPECKAHDFIAVRGELIMKKQTFNTYYKESNANARNMVSGIVNTKSGNGDMYKDVDFVAYEVIEPSLSPKEQFEILSKKNIYSSIHRVVDEDNITNENLSKLLVEWREKYLYEIDGVIVTHNEIYPRRDGNPRHSIAFKMVLSDQIAEAKVLDVLWSPSKDGYLKPRIRIEPVAISGAKIEYATAFNAAYVIDNNIGIGALIQIIRSGDVIPHILKVVQPAEFPKLPDVEYEWNDTHVDIMLIDKDGDETVREKMITAFFVGIGVVGLSSGNIKRIIAAGFDSVSKILRMSIDDLLTVEGFKEKMASKVFKSIQKQVENVTIIQLLGKSNIFGRGMGERRIKSILTIYPDILISDISDKEKIANISILEGFAIKTSRAFVGRIQDALAFLNDIGLSYKYSEFIDKQYHQVGEINHPLNNIRVVITGFRSKDLEEDITKNGGIVSYSVSKNVDFVIVHNLNEDTGKADKARKLHVPIVLEVKFRDNFSI